MQLKLEDLDFPPPNFHHCGDPGVTIATREFAAKVQPVYQLLQWTWQKNGKPPFIPTVDDVEIAITNLIVWLHRDGTGSEVECCGLIVRYTGEGFWFGLHVSRNYSWHEE
jgi:hypothetical protein